jgi:hypothetical protein
MEIGDVRWGSALQGEERPGKSSESRREGSTKPTSPTPQRTDVVLKYSFEVACQVQYQVCNQYSM